MNYEQNDFYINSHVLKDNFFLETKKFQLAEKKKKLKPLNSTVGGARKLFIREKVIQDFQ